jgi:type I restriction enzyme S subunit
MSESFAVREAPASYQAAPDKQSVRPGYKQTEVGVIPEDWDVHQLGELLVNAPAYGIGAAAIPFDSSYPTYLRITDISEDGRFLDESKASVKHPLATNYMLSEGDLVLARTGASVGKSYLYDRRDGELVFAGFLIRARSDTEKLEPRYLKYFTHSRPYWNWIKVNSMRSGQPGINGREYASLLIPLPPTKAEQEAIAEALSDADALIEALEQLIAKKRQLKQGTMQELLSGKKRLPGFGGEWEVRLIGEFTDCTSGGTPSTLMPHYWNGSIRWMSSGELNLKNVCEVEGRITEEGLRNSSTKMIPPNCVLVGLAGQGKTRGTVAMNRIELCTNQSIAAVLPNAAFDSEYLYYNLDSRYRELRELSTGDGGRGGLNLTIIRSLLIPFPKLAEQTAIATNLSDMDVEIAALETRLAKTRELKQGMMHNLLTGKIRLV